jgi:hypothetical protein
MHYTRPDVPRLTGLDRLARLITLQHCQIAFNTIRRVEAWMSVKACIHLWREFDEHYHRFVLAVPERRVFRGFRVIGSGMTCLPIYGAL